MKAAPRAFVLPLLLLVATLLAGCSVKLAYNNLDRLARWSVNDYLGMNDAQRAYFDAAVEELLYWHRVEHLPRYASLLDALQTSLADGTDEKELESLVNTVLGWGEEIQDRALPIAVELLGSLEDEQVALLARRLEESNVELAEPEAQRTPEEARAGWAAEFEERFTRFSGRLTAEQGAYLERQSVRYIPELELWADYRRRWQADLLKLLERRHDRETLESGLKTLAAEREAYYGEEFAAVYESNLSLTREVSVWMINALTPAQRERFFRRLEELAADLRDLSGQAPDTAPGRDACLITC